MVDILHFSLLSPPYALALDLNRGYLGAYLDSERAFPWDCS